MKTTATANDFNPFLCLMSAQVDERKITGIPEGALINFVAWSPKGDMVTFTVRCGKRLQTVVLTSSSLFRGSWRPLTYIHSAPDLSASQPSGARAYRSVDCGREDVRGAASAARLPAQHGPFPRHPFLTALFAFL